MDWDVRLKAQLQDFALASRAFLQPLTHHRSIFSSILSSTLPPSLSNLFTPPTLHVPPISKPVSAATMGSPLDDLRQLAPYTTVNITLPLHRRSSHALPSTVPPKTSPYGDDWDVLWLGHCGTELPTALAPRFREPDAAHPILPSSLLRLALSPDFTVPDPTFLRPHPFANQDPMSSLFAPHTRVLHLAGEGTACSLAYAVSQRGARRMLARYGGAGWGRLDKGWDLAMADWCGGFGTDEDVGPAGEKLPDEDSLRSEQEWEAVMARLAREEALAREQEKANGTTNATATTTTTRVRPTGTLTVPAPEMSVDPFEIALAEPSRPSETGGIMYGLSGGSAVRQMATAGDGSGGGAELGRPVPRWKPRPPPVCLTVQPPLINHHLRAGTQGGSDIQGVGGGFVEDISRTPYVRRSVMMNLRMMLDLDFGRRFSGSVRDEVVRKGGMRRAQVVDPRWEMLTEQYPDPPPPISFDDPSLNATETATTTVTGTATATATGTKTTTVDAATTASSGRGSLRAWFNRGRKTH